MKKTVCMFAALAGTLVFAVPEKEQNIPEESKGEMPQDAVTAKMEKAVPPDVWAAYRASHPKAFWLFGEERRFAVRNDIIPAHWFAEGSRADEIFTGYAQPGEYYPFQVCVVSEKARSLKWSAETDLAVSFITPAECSVRANGVKPIWVMVDIPKDAAGKTFRGVVHVRSGAGEASSFPFEIAVRGPVLKDGGINDAWRLSRLKWLNSDIGRDESVTKPYIPVSVDIAGRKVKILGRDLILGADGLPRQIVSYFSGSNARILDKGCDLLSAPFVFRESGLPAGTDSRFEFSEISPTSAKWRAETDFGGMKRIVEGKIDFTGICSFRIRHEGGTVSGARLDIRMPCGVARFMEGLGRRGGFLPDGRVVQKWSRKLNRDAVWIGRINGGIAVRFKGANYRRPLVNAYYAWRPNAMPESWSSGDGAIAVEKTASGVLLSANGADAKAGAEWNFDLFITPFRKLDMKSHLGERYLHLGQRQRHFDAQSVRKAGATVVNLHHNTLWNPYINYPYNDDGGPYLKKVVDEAHKAGLSLKIYYTTRELTQNLPEFFALKSLDGEVIYKRDESVKGWPCTNGGGPHPWIRAHVGLDVIPAWRENVRFGVYQNRLDLAVITAPETRWDNFFLEGLDHLVREYGIDGIYIDDTALTGESMQRARRILDRDGKRRLVDNHSWSHDDPRAGSGTSNLAFMDLYPYFDLLWRGEGFRNSMPPDLWLMERSGIPFGIPGEMLGRGNPFKGLVFGMTDRWGWGSAKGSPRNLWRFFDRTQLGDAELIGWWDDDNPVSVSGSGDVKASVWKGRKNIVLAVANFADRPRKVKFAVDRTKLDIAGENVKWDLAEIEHVQKGSENFDLHREIEIPGDGGLVLVAETR